MVKSKADQVGRMGQMHQSLPTRNTISVRAKQRQDNLLEAFKVNSQLATVSGFVCVFISLLKFGCTCENE